MSKQTSHGKEHKKKGLSPEDEALNPQSAEGNGAEGDRACEAPGSAENAEARIAELEAELEEIKDQYLRKAAEFENFRKRINKEKQDAIEYANQSLLLDLIPVIDDFERAIKSSETSRDFDSFYEGVTMIEKRLISQLENKWGLKRFESAGEAFDPNRHEAIMVDKSSEVDEPVVAEDFLKGYTLKDRVIRSAKVKVLMPEQGENAPSAGRDTDTEEAEEGGEA